MSSRRYCEEKTELTKRAREMQAWQRRMGFISRWASRPAPDSPAWFTGLQCGNPWFIAAEWRTRECCASNETPVPYYSHVCFTLSFTIYPQLFATSITAIFMRGRKVHIKWEYNLCDCILFEYRTLISLHIYFI